MPMRVTRFRIVFVFQQGAKKASRDSRSGGQIGHAFHRH